MIFRPSRARRTDDPLVNEKMLIFAIGAVCAVAGMAFEIGWLVYVAIAVLVIGVLLRFVRRGGGSQGSAE